MKIHGVKREWSRPFWVRFKKHHCPACNALLTTIKVSKIVNSKSEEAKNFGFFIRRYLHGGKHRIYMDGISV